MKIIKVKTCRDCPYVKGAGIVSKPFLCRHQLVRFNDLTIIQPWCQLEDANSTEQAGAVAQDPQCKIHELHKKNGVWRCLNCGWAEPPAV